MKRLKAIVLGATGATGQELVKLLLNDPNFSKVSIFVRKKPRIKHEKLTTYEIDFSRLNEYKGLINGDVIFSALGTTLSQAGSKTRQYLVDFNYQYEFAKIGSEILGGKGGGGRPDFAQAGGIDSTKIDEAITKIKSLI